MAVTLSARRLEALTRQVAPLAEALADQQVGHGPHWVSVSDLLAAFQKYGLDITAEDLAQALEIAARRGLVKVEGQPPHSVAALLSWSRRPTPE